jgi:hypothetical protein
VGEEYAQRRGEREKTSSAAEEWYRSLDEIMDEASNVLVVKIIVGAAGAGHDRPHLRGHAAVLRLPRVSPS